MEEGVQFWCYADHDKIIGVMVILEKSDVTLIRHAYVKTAARNMDMGSKLLNNLSALTTKPILIGTWAGATWAINFYKKYGFVQVSFEDKEFLLRKYWRIPLRQIKASVGLENARWIGFK